MGKCPIWGTEAEVLGSDVIHVTSPRAGGHYTIAAEAVSDYPSLNNDTRRKLTTWIIDQNHLGNKNPLITSQVFDDFKIRPLLSVHTRAERLLLFFESKLEHIGDKIV